MRKPPSVDNGRHKKGDVDIEALLSAADPKLGKVIAAVTARVGIRRIEVSHSTPFEALTRAIIYQRNSRLAAASIYAKLQSVVAQDLSPRKVLALPFDKLRGAGLSHAKATYVRSLAEWFAANGKLAKTLPDLPDAEIIQHLTGIPGIGVWTANVFLIFNLGRADVIPTADLGIRRAVQFAYGLKSLAPAPYVEERASLWKPYRSIASIYLWHVSKLKLTPSDLK